MTRFVPSQLTERIAVAIGQASETVRQELTSSIGREAEGQRGSREDTFTDNLVELFSRELEPDLEKASDDLSKELNTTIRIKLGLVNVPTREEARYGMDLGLKLSLTTDTAAIEKGVLIQCKRMFDAKRPRFPELSTRGVEQAKKMLRITPASFFLLYNFGEPESLFDLAANSSFYPLQGFFPWRIDRWSLSPWNLGMAIIPASNVLAMSKGPQGSKINASAKTILPGCIPFGIFIADLFVSCLVGDTREDVVNLVTAPQQRKQKLSATRFDGIDIRNHLHLQIKVGDTILAPETTNKPKPTAPRRRKEASPTKNRRK